MKVYYSTKEVAEMFGVKESLLRYWEKVFPTIRPKTIGNGIRQYSQNNIDEIKVVYSLVKVRGFKLDAAAKMLKQNRQGVDKRAEALEKLQSIRQELVTLKGFLDELG